MGVAYRPVLIKSKIMAGLQCPRRLWLQVRRQDLAAEVDSPVDILTPALGDWVRTEVKATTEHRWKLSQMVLLSGFETPTY